ncbi:hypothetical protein MBOT_10250 [Mycobacterium botniense]|uniref:Glycosyltransferase family 28 N-terminal domain-containing protein n=1 Tax=Mycobacterium botniense TaxID=84962 RepID=A0A7I9XV96_9MYCO|nr:glycosyltransferase [Mycobacterium botniense]GFG73660.1 hypothetical protein MBOT_10250 [Mycobacterium botniense]
MKFALACYGTRGDVEPGAALGRELLRRRHEVHKILDPSYLTRAREFASRMTTAADSVAMAADLVEDFARRRRFG